jgi:ATPase subunit of ABC transporter with duplicated ATPase domains
MLLQNQRVQREKAREKTRTKKAKDLNKDKKGKKKSEMDVDATATPASSSVPGSSRASTSHEPEKVFKILKTNMTIPKGQIVGIVGPVGSGKSSFLQGLIGEMRRGDWFSQVCWITFLLSLERMDPGMPSHTLRYHAVPN